jgi:heme exporter protein A
MLEVDQLACMRGDALLFRGLSFGLAGGGLLHVAGRNGAGKTSLLRLLCGLMLPEEGEIRWHGKAIRAQREEYHGALLFLGHANAVKDEFSALENLRVACALAGRAVHRRPVQAGEGPGVPGRPGDGGQDVPHRLTDPSHSPRPVW